MGRFGQGLGVGCACTVALLAARSLAAQPPSPPATPPAVPATPAGPPSLSPSSADTGLALGAYHAALAEKRLDASGALGTEQLAQVIQRAEAQLALGRRDEAISQLAAVSESPRFAPLADLDEGRALVFLLGDALGRAGAYPLAREYLARLIRGPKIDSWCRRAVSSLVDFGLESGDPASFLSALAELPAAGREPWAGDVAYLQGILHERAGRSREALLAYAQVAPNARFWAQASYRAGLLEVDAGQLGKGEQLFCRIADPKQTPKVAPLFGGNDFFQVRDLSRLALGRVAHEQYRFDDARYYYHLVPGDSERLPEALYESATSRYESKDYASAHALLDELHKLERHHPYEDEAWILDAYVDLAQCEFPRAAKKLQAFLKRYEPVLGAARQLRSDPRALRALLAGEDGVVASRAAGSGEVRDLLGTAIRVDSSYGVVTRQIADLDHQLSGLRAAKSEITDLRARVNEGGSVVPRAASALADGPSERLERLGDETAAVRRSLREAVRGDGAAGAEHDAIQTELIAVEADALALKVRLSPAVGEAAAGDADHLPGLLAHDAALALEMEQGAGALRTALVAEQDQLAQQALSRLELRLTRLVRRARAGRIETVLGTKRALEIEVEALSQGFLPKGAVDSLDAARYLSDNEEYWPFDGEDWEDEYVGGEGLR